MDLTSVEAADFLGVEKQALYHAIYKKRLPAQKVSRGRGFCWQIKHSDLIEYQENRYSRSVSRFEGSLTFDKAKGEYSVREASEIIEIRPQNFYHLIRRGLIPYKKKGGVYVLKLGDIEKLKKKMVVRNGERGVA